MIINKKTNLIYLLHQNIVVTLKSQLHIIFTFQVTNTVFSLHTLPSTSFTAFLKKRTFSKKQLILIKYIQLRFEFQL